MHHSSVTSQVTLQRKNKATSQTFFFDFEAELIVSVVKLAGCIFWLYSTAKHFTLAFRNSPQLHVIIHDILVSYSGICGIS